MADTNAMRAIWEARRKASVELVTALGYSPHDILDQHNGLVFWDHERRLILHVVDRNADGEPIIDGDEVRTHVERVQITAEQLAAYKAAALATDNPP